jgi:hypothetical protein
MQTSNHPRLILPTESGMKVMQPDNQRERRPAWGRSGLNECANCGGCMNSPLSPNELVILDRQMAMVARHLSEIAALLESRQGEASDHAVCARIIEEGFANLARKIHNQTIQVAQDPVLMGKSQSA